MEVRRIRIKGVKRIVIPQSAQLATNNGAVIEIKGKRRSKRKKQSKSLKLVEKMARRSGRSGGSIIEQYLKRHNRSNRKKKDGWLKDLSKNSLNAINKGRKRFKLSALF
ncbi:MAG TPA: hypothetical protein VM694_08355 [Polyangium sp.]|nr:hypothetical protein [Polyangium sp.]